MDPLPDPFAEEDAAEQAEEDATWTFDERDDLAGEGMPDLDTANRPDRGGPVVLIFCDHENHHAMAMSVPAVRGFFKNLSDFCDMLEKNPASGALPN